MTAEKQYCIDQLKKVNINGQFPATVKLRGAGVGTKWMSLNKDSALTIIEWLCANFIDNERPDKKLKSGDVLTIEGRRWFDKVNNNTYHSVRIILNAKVIYKSEKTYGYSDQYIVTALKYLNNEGYTNRDSLYYLHKDGIKVFTSVTDGLKKNLKF